MVSDYDSGLLDYLHKNIDRNQKQLDKVFNLMETKLDTFEEIKTQLDNLLVECQSMGLEYQVALIKRELSDVHKIIVQVKFEIANFY